VRPAAIAAMLVSVLLDRVMALERAVCASV
jgi:hypothetical protein